MKTVDQVIEDLKKEPHTDDIIKDLFPNSTSAYMLICGRSGIGKTNLVLYLAFCIAIGMKFFSLETNQILGMFITGFVEFQTTFSLRLNFVRNLLTPRCIRKLQDRRLLYLSMM